MSRAPLVFRTLGVRRMPGITDGGWELRDLSPGVNVVWGPNGAGKTTTASALQRLLWPSPGEGRAELHARLGVAGAEWRGELDGATARWQRGGSDASLPGIPSATERDRYRLSLHELLSETDGPLAECILRESAGGFDVGRAADALGFRAKAGQARAERQALAEAKAALQAARDAEAALRDDEVRLKTLAGELRKHRSRAGQMELWQRALERLDAAEAERSAREALERLPAELARIAGNEAEQLRGLRARLADARDRARTAEREVEVARAEMEASGLPAAGLPADVVPGLSAAVEKLRELADTRDRLARELEGALAACAAERTSIAGAVGEESLSSLTLPAVEELLAFAREAEQHRAELRAAEAETALHPAEAPGADAETLSRGRAILSEWLRLAEPETGIGRGGIIGLLACVLAAAAGAGLALLAHPAGWAASAIAVLLSVVLLMGRRSASDDRPKRQAEYGRLGLDAPLAWEPERVIALLERLEGMLAAARLEGVRAERRALAGRRLADLRARTPDLDRHRDELAARIGLAPGADEAAVAWLCQRVHQWQQARAEADRARAELRTAADQLARTMEEVERRFGAFATVSSPMELAGTLEDLRGRGQRFEQARTKRGAAELRRDEARADAARLGGECGTLLARAGLGEDGDARLDELCRLHAEYVEARRALDGAELAMRSAERRLRETAGFEEVLASQPRAAVLEALAASRDAAAEAEVCADEVSGLRERLAAARKRTDVEDALARVSEAEDALRACRDRDEGAAVGHALREFVERETRDRDRPAVFHRARQLFAAITRGRFHLEMADRSAAFRAVDVESGEGFGLDELSRGTRVQLLLAVRIAFIETMETGLALPLVLDEALGNSDDARAGAVMDAVMELAGAGRQVFFLTARLDEAERWMERLGAGAVPHALVDLGEARRMARFSALPRPAAPGLRLGAVPAPEGRDHAAYGALLRVPAVDVDRASPDGVHLWYLVEDPARLHRLLALGASTWGSLRTLVATVGRPFLREDEGAWGRLEALGRAVEVLLEAQRVGRGRAVEADALERSGAISPTFMERVEQVRRACGGRPDALLAAIRELPRFRGDNLEAFRDFLDDGGYLDAREPLDEAAVRAHVLAAMAPELRAGTVTVMDLERLMEIVGAAAEAPAEAARPA